MPGKRPSENHTSIRQRKSSSGPCWFRGFIVARESPPARGGRVSVHALKAAVNCSMKGPSLERRSCSPAPRNCRTSLGGRRTLDCFVLQVWRMCVVLQHGIESTRIPHEMDRPRSSKQSCKNGAWKARCPVDVLTACLVEDAETLKAERARSQELQARLEARTQQGRGKQTKLLSSLCNKAHVFLL